MYNFPAEYMPDFLSKGETGQRRRGELGKCVALLRDCATCPFALGLAGNIGRYQGNHQATSHISSLIITMMI